MFEYKFYPRNEMLEKIDKVQKDLDAAKELIKSEGCYRYSTMIEIDCTLVMASVNLADVLETYRAELKD